MFNNVTKCCSKKKVLRQFLFVSKKFGLTLRHELFTLYFLSEDPAQIGKGISLITVQDINDNAPEFAIDYETLLCENTMPGQVRHSSISEVCSQKQPADSKSH